MNRRYERYERDLATRQRYGKSWQRVRKLYAEAHPFCEQCLDNGVIVPVDEVHHKLPLAEGGTNDFENLISLCKSCHARLHAKRGDRWNKGLRTGTPH